MSLLDSLKPFWPLLLTFVLPRAWSYFNTLKTAYRTRPAPQPLPPKSNRSLTILFFSSLIFLLLSLRRPSHPSLQNIFATTNTRLGVPSDLLFSRLATLRPQGTLTTTDEALRNVLTTKDARQMYLRYGPDTLLNCPFCTPDDPLTYTLYHLSTNVLLPHLLDLLALGLATSQSISGITPSQFRGKFTILATVLCLADVYLTSLFSLASHANANTPAPTSLFVLGATLRPLVLCVSTAVAAFLIWASSTGRLVFFPFLSNPNAGAAVSPDVLQQQSQQLVQQTGLTLQIAQSRLRALGVARNAVVRDGVLSGVERDFWGLEGIGIGIVPEDMWQEEDVRAAFERAGGSVERARRETGAFVEGVTRGLEQSSSAS